MVLFIVFCPIVAAILIMAGAPARRTALLAAGSTFVMALLVFALFERWQGGFQHVSSFTISADWRLNFTVGLDGLSLIMVLLAAIVTLAAVWFTGEIDKYENAFYACLLLISGGAIGAFAFPDLREVFLTFFARDFPAAFFVRLATAVPSVSQLPSKFPDPAQRPTEHVPSREKREALESE